MNMNEYQDRVNDTAIYREGNNPYFNYVYPVLGLTGEAGEVAEKYKKCIRDGVTSLFDARDKSEEIAKELGDVLWYVAAIAGDMGYTLEEIATMNIDKLQDRAKRGVLKGSGDNR